MAQRALLIGSQTGELSGVEADVLRMAEALAPFGFETRACVGEDATRDMIFQNYERLISDSAANDAALVFYSGHGGLAPNPDYQPMDTSGVVRPRWYQFIVPFDFDQSTQDDFRGIIDIELSALLAALTEKTRNTTLVLDCCHAARMSRDVDMMSKALSRPWQVGVAAHIESLRAHALPVDRLALEGNPEAVRLVACGPGQSAFEYSGSLGRIGLLTESLIVALRESQELRISWSRLGDGIRRRVLELAPTQRPEVEGPASRLLFGLETLEETGIVPVEVRSDGVWLLGGRLLGLEVDDEYRIIAPGQSGVADADVALAKVTRVQGARAGVLLTYSPGHTALPQDARAIPMRKGLHRYRVRITGVEPIRTRLSKNVADSSHVQVASESTDETDIVARVEITKTAITLHDPAGNPIAYAKAPDETGIRETVQNLTASARAQALRELRGGVGANELRTPFIVEWGRVDQERPHPLAKAGELLFAGERLFVRVANQGVEKLYFSIFDIGVSSRIGLVTDSEPSGIEVLPGTEYVLGADGPSGRLVGQPVDWPPTVPRDGRHIEMLVVIVSDRPQDLRALEQMGMRSESVQLKAPETELELLMDQVSFGGTREVGSQGGTERDVRYAVEQVTFFLDPNPGPDRDVTRFLIDERADLSLLYQTPRSGGSAPIAVAVRLTDLVVHRNRMLFGSEFGGDIRVDTVVVTGPSADTADSAYRLETARFPGIKDGDRLPFDNLLVFHGSVAKFLDVGVWVSRDKKDSPTLAELFQQQLNSAEFRTAGATLATLAVAAPQAAVVVGALGAAATICNITSRLLSAALGQSIGLYRTSVLAQESFGIGRHPASGMMKAQDFSFGFEILATD